MGVRLSKTVQDNLYRQRYDVLAQRILDKKKGIDAALKNELARFKDIKRGVEYELSTIEPKLKKLDMERDKEERDALAAIGKKYDAQAQTLQAKRDKAKLPLKKFYAEVEEKFGIISADAALERVDTYGDTRHYINLAENDDPREQAGRELTALLLDLELSDNASMRDLVAKWLAA